MLGKLIKHEFSAVSRILIPLHLFLVVITIIGKMTLGFDLIQHLPELVNFLLLLTYIMVLVTIPIATMIYLVIRFYRNLYTDEGYLMWTLPAKPWEHLLSKGIVFSFWSIIDIILVFASLLFLVFTGQIQEKLSDPAVWSEFNHVMEGQLGIDFTGFMLIILLTCIVGSISSTFTYYCSICIGQLFSKHRVLGAFLAYFVLYLIMQVIGTAFMMMLGFRIFSQNLNDFSYIYTKMFTSTMLLSAVTGVICYFISLYIMKKKLNLQ